MSGKTLELEAIVGEDGQVHLDIPSELPGGKVRVRVTMEPVSPEEEEPQPPRLSAVELMKLPSEEQDRILAEQAAKAEYEYRNNPDLTDFEAFDEDNFYDETP